MEPQHGGHTKDSKTRRRSHFLLDRVQTSASFKPKVRPSDLSVALLSSEVCPTSVLDRSSCCCSAPVFQMHRNHHRLHWRCVKTGHLLISWIQIVPVFCLHVSPLRWTGVWRHLCCPTFKSQRLRPRAWQLLALLHIDHSKLKVWRMLSCWLKCVSEGSMDISIRLGTELSVSNYSPAGSRGTCWTRN